LHTPSTLIEGSGKLSSSFTSTTRCDSNVESTRSNKSGDVDCCQSSKVTTSNITDIVESIPATSSIVVSMNDQSSSWGTPFVPNHPMIAKSNDVISTRRQTVMLQQLLQMHQLTAIQQLSFQMLVQLYLSY